MTSELYNVLESHYERQTLQKKELGGKLNSSDFIVVNEIWELVDPNLATKWMRELMQKLDEKEM